MNDDVITITDNSADAAGGTIMPSDPDIAVLKAEGDDSKKLPERAVENADGSIDLPLFVPVVLRWRKQDSDQVTADPAVERVTFRRLTGKDVRVVMNAGAGDAFFNELTYASVKQQFPSKQKWMQILDRMDGADTAACIRIAQHFLENGPRTPGPSTSPR